MYCAYADCGWFRQFLYFLTLGRRATMWKQGLVFYVIYVRILIYCEWFYRLFYLGANFRGLLRISALKLISLCDWRNYEKFLGLDWVLYAAIHMRGTCARVCFNYDIMPEFISVEMICYVSNTWYVKYACSVGVSPPLQWSDSFMTCLGLRFGAARFMLWHKLAAWE